jgi:hypothetical protein
VVIAAYPTEVFHIYGQETLNHLHFSRAPSPSYPKVTKNVASVENKRLSPFPSPFDIRNSMICNAFSSHYIGTEYAQDKEDRVIFSIMFMNKNLKSFQEVRR